MNRLHYFYDPQCGWCYAVAPLIKAAAQLPGVQLVMHGGGLWPRPTLLPRETRERIRQLDLKVAELTGQPLGQAYLDDLLPSEGMLLHSAPTTAAVLAAASLQEGADLRMLRALQTAHYVQGAHTTEQAVQLRLAAELGLDPKAFMAALDLAKARAHIEQSQGLMQRLGVKGFPTTLVESRSGFTLVPTQDWFGKPEGFVGAVQAALGERLH